MGLEAASRPFSEANKGFQALAAEMMNYFKAAWDDAIRTWEQLIGVRSREQAMQIQSDYASGGYCVTATQNSDSRTGSRSHRG
jgi:hypothetical protein